MEVLRCMHPNVHFRNVPQASPYSIGGRTGPNYMAWAAPLDVIALDSAPLHTERWPHAAARLEAPSLFSSLPSSFVTYLPSVQGVHTAHSP